MKDIVSICEIFVRDLVAYLPPGLAPATASAFIENGKYLAQWRGEFIGTLLMVVMTFSAGKWIGADSEAVAWVSHAAGVVASDYISGGQHVNPAVTMSMWALGHCSYTDAYVRVAAQMAGGLVAFPVYAALSDAFDLPAFGGPEFDVQNYDQGLESFISEFGATLLLLWTVYIVNWEINFGTYHYIIKQTLTAIAVRALIILFPTAGPAMNPMLATAWAVFSSEKTDFPTDFLHYFVYWVSPFLAALLASVLYVIYAGGTIYGSRLPIGPIRGKKLKKH